MFPFRGGWGYPSTPYARPWTPAGPPAAAAHFAHFHVSPRAGTRSNDAQMLSLLACCHGLRRAETVGSKEAQRLDSPRRWVEEKAWGGRAETVCSKEAQQLDSPDWSPEAMG